MATIYQNLSDSALLHEMGGKEDEAAFMTLYDRYKHLVFGVCLKYLKSPDRAKKAVKEVFIYLWNSPDKYKDLDFKVWVYNVTRSYCQKGGLPTTDVKETPKNAVESGFYGWNNYLEIKDQEQIILNNFKTCLKTLEPAEFNCVEQFYIDNKNYKQTAALTGFSYQEVRSYIFTGRAKIIKCISTHLQRKD